MRRLLIRPGAIGDCILSFPALQSLRSTYTEIWVPTPIVPLIDFADRVCSIAETGLNLVGVGDLPIDPALRNRLTAFDEIVSWYGASREEFRSALNALGVRCRFYQALPPPDATVHATDFFCSQVSGPAGASPLITVAEPPPQRESIVIHPFSGSAKKNWPLVLFRELAAKLPRPVEWLAGPEETLAEATRVDDLRELAGLLRGASLYIGNDSGITHLAAAVGVPTIALFLATDPAVWAPRGRKVTVLQGSELTVARVLEAASSVLNETPEAGR